MIGHFFAKRVCVYVLWQCDKIRDFYLGAKRESACWARNITYIIKCNKTFESVSQLHSIFTFFFLHDLFFISSPTIIHESLWRMCDHPPGGLCSLSDRMPASSFGFFRRRAAAGNGGTALNVAAAVWGTPELGGDNHQQTQAGAAVNL